ncbi:C-terminal helicase domain-containing protein [Paenibacillus sp. HJGM_3]|uniref:C-terminal helicase domain-containing protein n=1 Tax=Paenibacillus sp. HJGM_3 TaxID=3379816 RepID=UPI00385E667A
MNVIEKQISVSLEPAFETEYLGLLNEYFAASERNGRASSIHEKKKLMAVKEEMARLCNMNPQKINMLKAVIQEVRDSREKLIVLTKSNAVANELLGELAADEEMEGVLLLHAQMSIHEVNQIHDRFNKSPRSTVLLVTDAVNTGLDFTAANHLLHYDYPIRYNEMIQRNLRITKQTSPHSQATIYYLVTTGKIDDFDYRECRSEKEGIEAVSS